MTDTDTLRRIKDQTRTIAVVGLSPNQDRPSWGVARYLQGLGYKIVPVNPGHAGKKILDEPVFASLADIPADLKVDMVDVFRRSDAVAQIVDEALSALPDLKTIWLQLGVHDDQSAQRARDAGITVVQDRCPKIEFPRLS